MTHDFDRGRDWPIAQLPGLTPEQRSQLHAAGIESTQQLLERLVCANAPGAIAGQLGLREQLIRKWGAMSDLARVPSVGCQFCGLILHAGIASVEQLAGTPAPRLHRQIVRLHVAWMQRRDTAPSLATVRTWIQEARSLLPRTPIQ